MLPSVDLSDELGVGSQELLLLLVTPPGPDRWSLPMGSHRSAPLVWPQQRVFVGRYRLFRRQGELWLS